LLVERCGGCVLQQVGVAVKLLIVLLEREKFFLWMIMAEIEWILARFRNCCETLCISRVLQLFWSLRKQRERKYIVQSRRN